MRSISPLSRISTAQSAAFPLTHFLHALSQALSIMRGDTIGMEISSIDKTRKRVFAFLCIGISLPIVNRMKK